MRLSFSTGHLPDIVLARESLSLEPLAGPFSHCGDLSEASTYLTYSILFYLFQKKNLSKSILRLAI